MKTQYISKQGKYFALILVSWLACAGVHVSIIVFVCKTLKMLHLMKGW